MKLTVNLSVLVLAGTLGMVSNFDGGAAQGLIAQPAEFPPASYTGKQYVDSRGCVFIRAGIDGDVSWVPRVTRDRTVVCGFEPTFPTETVTAPVEVEEPVAPVDLVIAPPEPEPAPVVIATPDPQPAARAPAPAPRRTVIRRTPTPVAAPKSRVPMPAAPAIAPVRTVRGDQLVTGKTRLLPRHLLERRLRAEGVRVPKGYRPIWTDDRLNPRRAEQNLQGRAQMAMVWTNTVPRRLIDTSTGRDVTASTPLIYPYTDVQKQRAAIGEVRIVRRNGKVMKQIIRKPVYSSRSKPRAEDR